MAWNDADSIVIASNGEVNVAPVGTALPTTPTANLNAAFVGLGYANEDGATFTVTPTVTDIMAWQSRQAVRRELTNQEVQLQFNLMQWDENTVPLAFGGGAITTPSAGIYKYTPPVEGDALDERALVIDWNDGAKHYRLMLPRGNVTDAVASQLRRSAEALLPIAFKALQPGPGTPSFTLLTDDTAFAAGS